MRNEGEIDATPLIETSAKNYGWMGRVLKGSLFVIITPLLVILAVLLAREVKDYFEVRNAVKASLGESVVSFGKVTEHGWSDRCVSVEVVDKRNANPKWKAAHVIGAFEGGDWKFSHWHYSHDDCWGHAAG